MADLQEKDVPVDYTPSGIDNNAIHEDARHEFDKDPAIVLARIETADVDVDVDVHTVSFVENDPENPLNWSSFRKWTIVANVSIMSMVSIFATTTIIPAVPQVLADLHVHDDTYGTFLVSIWELGEGTGPFFIGPLAEKFGRLPVYHVGNLLGLLCCIASALCTNISMLLAFRFLSGMFLPTLTLAPAIIGDLFQPEQCGTAMAIGYGFQLIGPVLAPICGSFIAGALGWRWSIWLDVILIGFFGLTNVVLLRETYSVKILEQKAARLRKETGNERLHSALQSQLSAISVYQSITQPMQVLFRSSTVAFITAYTALAYALSYTILTTLTEIMELRYGWGKSIVGLAFIAQSLGYAIGIALYALTSDRYITYKAKQFPDGAPRPKDRLIHMLLGACILPLGFLLYGWTSDYEIVWVVPLIGVAIIGISTTIAILPTENYLVDAYKIHSASALSAGVILRAISGALFPLCAPTLYKNLGLGWGNSVLALCAAIFIPPVVFLLKYG